MSFPYPPQIIPSNISTIYTIYGTKNCENCTKIKEFFKKKFKKSKKIVVKYYDIDDLIQKKIIKNFSEFQEKMEPFIHNYKTVPIIFINDLFIGGYSEFMDFLKNLKSNKKLNKKPNINSLKSTTEKDIDNLIQKIFKKLI
jgi:glutaredoxin